MKVLITGGTGFVGRALQETMLRNFSADEYFFVGKTSSLTCSGGIATTGEPWDVTEPCRLAPEFDAIIHAATPASAFLNSESPQEMVEIIYLGMRRVLDFVAIHPTAPQVLFISSGAVYGETPTGLKYIDELYSGAALTTTASSAYAEAKRMSEVMLSIAVAATGVRGTIARLFAFSGPHLPRDRHFAIGNFVRDAVHNQRISVRSDGSAVRSYLDERDMAEWLLAILRRGEPGFPYHVGSERPISIRDLAFLTASRYSLMTGNHCDVEILGQTSPLDGVSRYVPSTKKTRELLGVEETISLEESLDSMIEDALVNDSPPR